MKKLALCIGNDAYTILPELNCCVSDATAVSNQLSSLGFDTILKTNLNREEMADEILNFVEKIDRYNAVLLYYAGHGFQADGDNILAPIDLNINNRPAGIRLDAFPMSELMNQLNKYPDQTKIVVLDACRALLGYRGTFHDFAPISAPQGSVIAFATSPGQSSTENSSTGHGRYTDALLRYMSLPRVPVETVFKKVRESLVAETGGAQIPWEHTSLIGDFYFNPDTIYDGVSYCWEAKADAVFHFNVDSYIKSIVDGLKTQNWPQQEEAINKVPFIEFDKASGNEMFVLGRNIYQAACGNSFACQRFIDCFGGTTRIPDQAKIHILNGMAYEIYFTSQNMLRKTYKIGYYSTIIKYLEQPEFYASREFIASNLHKIEDRPIYIPGQNELVHFVVKGIVKEDGYQVTDIIYQGRSVFYDRAGIDKISDVEEKVPYRAFVFEQEIARKIVAPKDCIKFKYDTPISDENTFLLIPEDGFSLSFGLLVEEINDI